MSAKFQLVHFEEGVVIGGKNKKRPWPKLTQRGGLLTHGKGGSPGVKGTRQAVVPKPITIRRNQPCPCGSGHKFKQCCLGKDV
jgi:hypothetical protein